MNDIDFKFIHAEKQASKIIDEFGICSADHIRIRDISYAKGAIVVEQEIMNASASIVKSGKNATIRISPMDNEERKRFSIAHELGHLFLGHLESIKKVCSDTDMMEWYHNNIETQANFFASELILPSKLLKKKCDVRSVNFEPIRMIAHEFRASLTASAIKFVRLCPEKCALVCSQHGKVKWFYKSSDWDQFIRVGDIIDKRTLAFDYFHGDELSTAPEEVEAEAWIHGTKDGVDEVVEHSIASTQYGFVLSILWIKPFI